MAEVHNPNSDSMKALSIERLTQLIGQPPQGIHEEVESIVNSTLSLLEDVYDVTVKRPEIVYDLKGTVAGRALGTTVNGNKEYRIRINNDLLYGPHKDEILTQTIPHEVAHIFVFQVWPGSSGHGSEWKRVMRSLGLPAKRCHQYEVKKARNRQKMDRPFIYACACASEHKLTAIRHRRIQNENRKYYCKRCGTQITFVRIGE